MDKKENKVSNIVLVDTSYTLFHRYFATLRWLCMANNDIYKEHIKDKDYNWLDNEIFILKYEKLYLEGISKLIGKRKFANSHIIFCMDTPKAYIWRTDIKSDYKADRLEMSNKTNLRPTFKYTYNTIIPNIIKKNTNMFKLVVKKLEADDIIGIISKYLEVNPNINIYIVSDDDDFKQLGRSNLFFVSFRNKKPILLTLNDAKISLHRKILLGDKSDNIKSIFPPKFSTKIKQKLVESIDEFNEFIKENKEIKKRYNENKELICFDNIPDEYRKHVINEYNSLFQK
jgi:5'-3' exonuclease